MGKFLLGFALGAAVGAAAVMLRSERSGTQTRSRIADTLREATQAAQHAAQSRENELRAQLSAATKTKPSADFPPLGYSY